MLRDEELWKYASIIDETSVDDYAFLKIFFLKLNSFTILLDRIFFNFAKCIERKNAIGKCVILYELGVSITRIE